MLLNLISNAVKFCPDKGGWIRIHLTRKGRYAQVDVADNGSGIAEEDKGLVFDRFWQIRHTAGGRPKGSGLGLAIARQIVEMHEGRIWVESPPGQGAVFSFTLPLRSAEAK